MLLFYKMINTSNFYCMQIIDLLRQHGVSTAYCCPGSRNAPLLIALDACKEIKKMVVVDERSAAFQALGCALVQQAPVVVVCTSGSAVLNYAPAVAEAYYAGVPLIIISADRPKEWIDQDDSQTIRQYGVLDHIVKGSYDIRAIPEGRNKEYSEDVMWTVNRTVNEAMLKALDGKAGPVHINVQLSDPLGATEDCTALNQRSVSHIKTKEILSQDVVRSLASDVTKAKVMLVAGYALPDNSLNKAVRMFGSLQNVVIMAETISNLHEPQPMSAMIDAVLCEMTDEEKEQFRPDIVISIGGALVSRMLKQYLRDYPPRRHWSVGHSNYFCDCFKSLTDKIEMEPACFIRQLYGAIRKSSEKKYETYSENWQSIRKKAAKRFRQFISNASWSDLKAFDYIFRHIDFDNLFVSNGTSIRYSQLIPHTCHAEYCNRGVSGIDGSVSTAVGGAVTYNGQTTLLTGDMSWVYDSGASALSALPHNMRIIVIDNSGGGIFRFIKSTSSIKEETLGKYFCVEDLPDIEMIAMAYGIEVTTAEDIHELEDGVEWLSEDNDVPRMLLVKTPSYESAQVLKSYFSKSKYNYD